MAAGGSSFVRNFGVRLVVLEGDSFQRATQQVVTANQAQAQSLRQLQQAQRGASGTSSGFVRSLREMAASIAVIDGPLGGVASRFNAFATVLTATGGAALVMGAAVSAVFFIFSRAIPIINQMEQSTIKLSGVMRATGGQIGLTELEIENFSRAMGLDTLASVNQVRDALTEVAVSGVVFGETATRLVATAQDLSAVFGGPLDQNLSLLLRSIIKIESGVEGFRERFGVQIPDALQRSIKAMQELGDTQGAAKAIIDFLQGRVGGAGQAAAFETIAGSIDKVGQRWQEFLESFNEGLLTENYVTFFNFLANKIREITLFVQTVSAQGGLLVMFLGPAESEVREALAQIETLVGLLDRALESLGGIRTTVSSLQEGGLPGLLGRLSGTAGEFFSDEEISAHFGAMGAQLGAAFSEAIKGGLEAAGLEESVAPVQRIIDQLFEAEGTGEQKLLQVLTQELGLSEEVAAAQAARFASEEQARNRIAAIAAADLETEIQRKEQVEAAAEAAQRRLKIEAQQAIAAKAAEEAAKKAAQLEEQRNNKQIQELLRIENVIERLNAKLLESQGGSTFEKIRAVEGGTTAFLLAEDEIRFKADQLDAREREEELFKRTEERLENEAQAVHDRITDQREATRDLAQAVSGELVGAWQAVTQAIIDGTDVAKAALNSLLNSALQATQLIVTRLIASGLAQGINAAAPGGAAALSSYFTFAQGGQFNVGDRGGSSVVHMQRPPGPGIFAGRAQRGLDFLVPGAGAADTVPVSFLATPGERVTVARPGEGGAANINLNISAPGATADTVEMLRVYGEGLIDQAVNRSVGRVMDLATRSRVVRSTLGGRRR